MDKKPLEIEYKFLIEYPLVKDFEKLPEYKYERLTQLYLLLPKGNSEKVEKCRIRKAEGKDGTRYVKTFKQSLSDMTRIEIESDISKEEYESLQAFRNPECLPIEKVRHSFSLSGFVYEVDIFPFWQDRAFLEIEVSAEDITPPIPDFIKIIKDVTSDKRYRNSALAKKIITEDI